MSKSATKKALKAAGGLFIGKVARKRLMRLSTMKWAAVGLGAYGLLHLMRRKGIFARQASKAIDLMDRGAQTVVKAV